MSLKNRKAIVQSQDDTFFFYENGRKYFGGATLGESVAVPNSKFPSFDSGFKTSLTKTPVNQFKSKEDTTIRVGNFSVSKGLTILLGPPSGGKSFFVDNRINDTGFVKFGWGEPDVSAFSQDFSNLMDHLSYIFTSHEAGGVIDSIMPLIISSDENLGQGGLSKRILTYIRQLASITQLYDKHLVLVANPLESGNFIRLWAEYFKAVAHSVIVVVDRKAAISSRLASPYANVPPNREFGGEDGFNSSLLASNFAVSSFEAAKDMLSSVDRKTPERTNGIKQNVPGVVLSSDYGSVPQLKGRSTNAADFK